MSKYRRITCYRDSQQGRRDENEDVERIKLNLDWRYTDCSKYDFLALYDGHGGPKIAQLVDKMIVKKMMMDDPLRTIPYNPQEVQDMYFNIQEFLKKKYTQDAEDSGCTSLVLIRYIDTHKRERLRVINVGDCRAVACKSGFAIPLSKDHKPNWSDEKIRIGNVNANCKKPKEIYMDGDASDVIWRVGDLSVTRAFGDSTHAPQIVPLPEIHDYSTSGFDFIIMACDGLWDVMTNDEAVNFVRDHLTDNNPEMHYDEIDHSLVKKILKQKNGHIAKYLTQYAIEKGSNDNVSVIVIVFEDD